MNFGSKLWPLEFTQGFSAIWPSDLVFDPTWPSFVLYPLLCTQGFSKPNFWLNMTQFQTSPTDIGINILTNIHELERTWGFSKI